MICCTMSIMFLRSSAASGFGSDEANRSEGISSGSLPSSSLSSEVSFHLRRRKSPKPMWTPILYTQVVNLLLPSKLSSLSNTRSIVSCAVSSMKVSKWLDVEGNQRDKAAGKILNKILCKSSRAASFCSPFARKSFNQVSLSRVFCIELL